MHIASPTNGFLGPPDGIFACFSRTLWRRGVEECRFYTAWDDVSREIGEDEERQLSKKNFEPALSTGTKTTRHHNCRVRSRYHSEVRDWLPDRAAYPTGVCG